MENEFSEEQLRFSLGMKNEAYSARMIFVNFPIEGIHSLVNQKKVTFFFRAVSHRPGEKSFSGLFDHGAGCDE